jgi:hypothetical protein
MPVPGADTRQKEQSMKSNQDLIGKTITSVVAVSNPDGDEREIWMLQFSDGSHVEFVSPEGKRRLRRSARRKKVAFAPPQNGLQLALIAA